MDRMEFLQKITTASRALRGRAGALNILAKDGRMELSCSSRNLNVLTRMEDAGCQDMKAAVKAETAVAAVTRLPGDEITISATDKGLVISGKEGRVTLPYLEYQDARRKPDAGLQVAVHDITRYVGQVVHSLDNSGFNPLMSTINVEIYDDGGFALTALDGKRSSMRNTRKKGSELAAKFVVFGLEFSEALKLAGDGEITICLPKDGNFIHIAGENAEMQIALYGEPYYNVSGLRSKKLPIRVAVKKGELLEALGLTRLVSNKAFVDITHRQMRVFSDAVSGKAVIDIPIRTYGMEEERTVNTAFNAGFLIDALESIDAEEVVIHLVNAMSQFVLTDGRFAIEIVMPVKR